MNRPNQTARVGQVPAPGIAYPNDTPKMSRCLAKRKKVTIGGTKYEFDKGLSQRSWNPDLL